MASERAPAPLHVGRRSRDEGWASGSDNRDRRRRRAPTLRRPPHQRGWTEARCAPRPANRRRATATKESPRCRRQGHAPRRLPRLKHGAAPTTGRRPPRHALVVQRSGRPVVDREAAGSTPAGGAALTSVAQLGQSAALRRRRPLVRVQPGVPSCRGPEGAGYLSHGRGMAGGPAARFDPGSRYPSHDRGDSTLRRAGADPVIT